MRKGVKGGFLKVIISVLAPPFLKVDF